MIEKKNINVLSLRQVIDKTVECEVGKDRMSSPSEVTKLVNNVLDIENLPQELFGMLTLNTKNEIMGVHVLSIGSLNSSLVHPREVFKAALLNNANSIMLFHNHPTGDTAPSPQDKEVTLRLAECGTLLGITVLDHVIIGDGYTSMRMEGML